MGKIKDSLLDQVEFKAGHRVTIVNCANYPEAILNESGQVTEILTAHDKTLYTVKLDRPAHYAIGKVALTEVFLQSQCLEPEAVPAVVIDPQDAAALLEFIDSLTPEARRAALDKYGIKAQHFENILSKLSDISSRSE